MADNVAITAGSGTTIATDDCGAAGHTQVIKLAISTDGSATFVPADAANGIDVDVTRTVPVAAGTATLANVAGAAASTTLIAANTARKGFVIVNDSTAILYVKFGSAASSTSYSYVLPPSTGLVVPAALEVLGPAVYTGIITGIWASATGNARTTELT